ncbi:glycosyltransferase family 2 protein [Crenothrix sp.]|uniref:glycosyltransferase family 2 protein n=1 Tax=Crenothrix sp. TaxID=3100433 RepID=UPI00374DE728
MSTVMNNQQLQPRISIVMPLYNKAATVAQSIASVLDQTVSNWELVVVDDGSTDEGIAVVSALQDPRIRLVLQVNAGVSAARNKGIAESRTDLIAFLDADDVWLPTFLESILALQKDFPQAQWFATSYFIQEPNGSSSQARFNNSAAGFSRGVLKDYFNVAIQSEPPVWTSAVAVNKGAIVQIGGFPVGVASGEDLLTWARLACVYGLAYDTSCHAVFQRSGIERRPSSQDVVGKALRELAQIYPDIAGLSDYIGLWYRMQSVMAMWFMDIKLARKYAVYAVRFGFKQMRNWYALIIAFVPFGWGNKLDSMLRNQIIKAAV